MAIDRTPEEQEEYNRLKKDIIKDIKKEIRKKDYNSSNKNTTSNSLTDIIKSRREAGEGVFSSLGGAAKERLKEKFDIKRDLPQGGLLTALFPKLMAYKAQQLNPPSGESAGVGAAPAGGDSLSSSKSLLDSISVSTKIISKNSMALPLIQKDTNLMRQTLKKIVKAMQARKKVVPTSKTTPVITKTTDSGATTGDLEPEKEQEKKQKNPIEKLIEMIKETFNDIKTKLTQLLLDLPGKIVSGIVTGIKALFTGAKIASSFLLSILKPLLGLVFSKVGLALLLAAGVFYALYKASQYLSKKIAEEVPDMKLLTPQQAANVLGNKYKSEQARSSAIIDAATTAAGRPKNKPFTIEEAVAYLKDQVENGKKYAAVGLQLVDEKNQLEKVLESGNKEQIEAAGGKEIIEKQISELKIKIANLGGESRLKEIISEPTASLPKDGRPPPVQPKTREEMINQIKIDSATSKNMAQATEDTRKDLRAQNAVNNTIRMDKEGYGKAKEVSLASLSPSLTGPAIDSSDGPGNTISTSVPSAKPAVPPAASGGTIGTGGTDEIRELIKSNENLMSAQDGPGQNQGFIGRIISPLPARHPVNESLTNASIVKLAYGYE